LANSDSACLSATYLAITLTSLLALANSFSILFFSEGLAVTFAFSSSTIFLAASSTYGLRASAYFSAFSALAS
jgi:hypothetical protein